MKKFMKKNKILFVAIVAYIIAFLLNKDLFSGAVGYTSGFLMEMLQILPPVFIITGLISVWIPSSVIQKNLGKDSSWKGNLISLFIGSISAGPIYAAFPATLMLFKKGASIANIVIIISSWAVIKLPMLLAETAYLGFEFAILRYVLTVPVILLLGRFMDRIIKRDEINEAADLDFKKGFQQ